MRFSFSSSSSCFLYLRLAPYFVRSSTGSSVVTVVNDDNVAWSVSFNEDSSGVSVGLVLGITVTVDDDDDDVGILATEVSSADGVVIDKAVGIWKSLAENPETILIGA